MRDAYLCWHCRGTGFVRNGWAMERCPNPYCRSGWRRPTAWPLDALPLPAPPRPKPKPQPVQPAKPAEPEVDEDALRRLIGPLDKIELRVRM